MDAPDIPENIEAIFKQYDGQLFVITALLAGILLRLEKFDGQTPEEAMQEIEELRKMAALMGHVWQDDWRTRRFDIAFRQTLESLRVFIETLPPLD